MFISEDCSDSHLSPSAFTSTRTYFIHQPLAWIVVYATSIICLIPLKNVIEISTLVSPNRIGASSLQRLTYLDTQWVLTKCSELMIHTSVLRELKILPWNKGLLVWCSLML